METALDAPVSAGPMEYAGFWLRFVAFIIDAIIGWIAQMIILSPFLALMGFGGTSMFDPNQGSMAGLTALLSGAYLLTNLASLLISWLYFALMESSRHQATIGKMALGLKVTDMAGEKISFGQATGRYFGKLLSSFIFLVGYIMAGFTEKKQALHDMLANTLVIKK